MIEFNPIGKIKDISLSDLGRKDITLAESEMPGLMTLRTMHRDLKPFKSVKISGSLHMTVQTAVLIETLVELGATVRWCSCNIFSTQDEAAAAVFKVGKAAVFAWKNETIEEYWKCLLQTLFFDSYLTGPDLLIDDGGDLTLFVHRAIEYENYFLENGSYPILKSDSEEDTIIHSLILDTITEKRNLWHTIVKNIKGVSEETTTGIQRLLQMSENNELLFPAINVNDSMTKSKFDNIYGCRHSLVDAILRATDIMLAGKKALVLGYGDVGKGCAKALNASGMRVFITEIDPICALQALMEGFEVVQIEDVVSECHLFVTCTGNCDVILVEHMEKMRKNAIVCNIGHFDNEIEVSGLKKVAKQVNLKPLVDAFVFENGNQIIVLAEGRLVNLACATGHPSFVMSCSFANQVLAQLELLTNGHKLKNEVYVLPKLLDEQIARIHVEQLGGKITKLTEKQANYINVNQEGPYKRETYRY